MDPSQSQIIANNPIGNRLDSFQEAFRSTCAKLSISESADAVQQVVKNGNKDLISDLIIILLGLPAARSLPSPDGSSTIAGELATLLSKLELNKQDLQAVSPLLTKVVEKAPDEEIWVAVYKLVTKSASQPTPLGELTPPAEFSGFDPTITLEGANRYMAITKEGKTERLVIVDVIKRHHSIIGRGTICWKAYHEGDESKQLLVVKDSWQYPERDEEGEYLLEAINSEVVNVARYYHHETVCVSGRDDVIVDNVRKGLDIGGAEYKIMAKMRKEEDKKQQGDLHRSIAKLMIQHKAQSKDANTSLSLRMPAVSTTPQEEEADPPRRDRVHRRVILHDYGQPLYEASSRVAMLAALEGAITGHQSLHQKAGILHRDISVNNVLVNEEDNSTWPGFLIDLDLAIREKRLKLSSALDKTGTKVFMAIGALTGETHSFMHDLESFFWVLFWICTHYTGPKGANRVVSEVDDWNFLTMEAFAMLKAGAIGDEGLFLTKMIASVTPYFQPLVLWINKLRTIVFPNDKKWRVEDEELYERMKEVLREAMTDPKVQAE